MGQQAYSLKIICNEIFTKKDIIGLFKIFQSVPRAVGPDHASHDPLWRQFSEAPYIYLNHGIFIQDLARFPMFGSLPGTMEPPHISAAGTPDWSLSLTGVACTQIPLQNQNIVTVTHFLSNPRHVIESANLHNFAVITPHYPGVRAPLESETCRLWQESLSDLLNNTFGVPPSRWEMRAWYSLVTTPPARLTPLQRFPHVDGTDPQQIAMMLYLHEGAHGGTAFFRHRSTGLEALTAETFPAYRAALEADVARSGLPPPAYPTDGAPHFERIHATSGAFNSAVFYRGNILHSGVIDNAAPLSDDPRIGRLTINAFFRPL